MATKKGKRGEQETKMDQRKEVVLHVEPIANAETQKAEFNRPDVTGEPENGRSSMAVEEMKVETERAQAEYKEMAKTWKDGYLRGLDACLQWQAENERLIKHTVKQGLSGSRQLLTWWKDWIEDQTQRQSEIQRNIERQANGQTQTNNVTNPFLGFTKQSTEAVLTTVEPILKNSEAAVESSFGYYENAVATPSRKYVREINKQVLDAVIPS